MKDSERHRIHGHNTLTSSKQTGQLTVSFAEQHDCERDSLGMSSTIGRHRGPSSVHAIVQSHVFSAVNKEVLHLLSAGDFDYPAIR